MTVQKQKHFKCNGFLRTRGKYICAWLQWIRTKRKERFVLPVKLKLQPPFSEADYVTNNVPPMETPRSNASCLSELLVFRRLDFKPSSSFSCPDAAGDRGPAASLSVSSPRTEDLWVSVHLPSFSALFRIPTLSLAPSSLSVRVRCCWLVP